VLVDFLGVARGFSADRCLTGLAPGLQGPGFRAYGPPQPR
jgi:hypothetical protein